MTIDLTSHLKTCRRSHPHEEMDDVCERYTEYERELATLREELSLTTGTLESRERNIETLNATIADMEVRHAAAMLHAQTHADEYNELQSSFEDEVTKRERAEQQRDEAVEKMQRGWLEVTESGINHYKQVAERAEAERDAALKDAERASWLIDTANKEDIEATLLSRRQPHEIRALIDAARKEAK